VKVLLASLAPIADGTTATVDRDKNTVSIHPDLDGYQKQ